MTLPLSQFSFCPSAKTTFSFPVTPKLVSNSTKLNKIFAYKPLRLTIITKACQEEDSNITTSANIAGPDAESQPEELEIEEMTELGMEIKRSMKGRGRNEELGFLSGVAEEIREIEWPSFNKVLGATGVVLAMIAGSSVVLFAVNAVLAELADRVFAGKGVQDFFG